VKNQIRLIIFDLDDTLIQSKIDYAALKKQLLELFPKSNTLTSKKTPILGLLSQLETIDSELYFQARTLVEETERGAALNAKIMVSADNIPKILSQYKIQGVIYTNNSFKTVLLYLQKEEFSFLKQFFILTRDDITKPKPDPEGILTILSRFSNIEKESTIYIGDSYIDAEAAYLAGIRWVLFDSRNIDLNEFITPPSGIISHWSELESLLKTL
jgi:phosphoglycolate phosphatase